MSGFKTVINRVIESASQLKTYLKNGGMKGGQSGVHSTLHHDVLVDQAKADHYGFGFLFPAKNQEINTLNGVDPHNPNGLHGGIPVAPPSMLHNPIPAPSSMPIVNHTFNNPSSIGGMNHTPISSPPMGIGGGFSNSPF